MSRINLQKEMLLKVAEALGDELLDEVVFLGGCTTGLLVTDEFTKEQIRYTEDVDLIIDIVGYPAWSRLQERLRVNGFKDPMNLDGDLVICRMLLDGLEVDFMPTDEDTLGFANKWYADAIETSDRYQLTDDVNIRLIKPEYFVATKIEAYLGRGNGDLLASRDIEDILNIFDGRESIVQEIQNSNSELKEYITEKLSELLGEYDFEMAVQSTSGGDAEREGIIFERIERSIEL